MFQSCDPQRSPWINLFFPLKTSVTTIFVSLLFFPPPSPSFPPLSVSVSPVKPLQT